MRGKKNQEQSNGLEFEKPLSVAMWKQIYGTVQMEKNTGNNIGMT